jgi:hypothetical protein
MKHIFYFPLLLFLGMSILGCVQPASDELENHAIAFYLNDQQDTVVYKKEDQVAILGYCKENGSPTLVKEINHVKDEGLYHLITNKNEDKKTAKYGVFYKLIKSQSNKYILTISILKKEKDNEFSKPYMNLGEFVIVASSTSELKDKVDLLLITATFKCCMNK